MTEHINYQDLETALRGLIEDEPDALANLANSAALIFHSMENINWAGFYLLRGDKLVLGAFQGKPACIRIALGRGVCGTAAEKKETLIVGDVHQFPGHIACDAASASEIVVPIIRDQQLVAVLDIDSPYKNRFSETDRETLEVCADILAKHIRWEVL